MLGRLFVRIKACSRRGCATSRSRVLIPLPARSVGAHFSIKAGYSNKGTVIIQEVNLHEKENAKEHHTERYEVICEDPPACVLRRGFPFNVGIRFAQAPKLQETDIRAHFTLGDDPVAKECTAITLKLPENIEPANSHNSNSTQWSVYLKYHDERGVRTFQFISSASTPVGRWTLSFTLGDTVLHVVGQKIYILFNPWLEGDQVFMDDADHRDFYVMRSTGAYFYGTSERFRHWNWYYGQFEKVTLETIELLLKEWKIRHTVLSDPILLSRTICAMVNSKNDLGILFGKWGARVTDGLPPGSWSSSTTLLNEYVTLGRGPVKYAHCFEFAMLLNSLLRCVGIPTRTVTIFLSAHDSNHDMAMDFFYDKDNMPIFHLGSEMDWPCHCWCESWMKRPDLPSGFDGWQVLDGSPWLVSRSGEIINQSGPFPVKAVLENRTELDYDGLYITAQLKAKENFFKEDSIAPTRRFMLAGVQENTTGRLLVTEKMRTIRDDPEVEDITALYKSTGAQVGKRNKVDLKLHHNSAAAGDPINIECYVTNNDSKRLNISVTLTTFPYMYKKKEPILLGSKSYIFCVGAESVTRLELTLEPEAYLGKIGWGGIIRLDAVATFGNHLINTREIFSVRMPELEIEKYTSWNSKGSPGVCNGQLSGHGVDCGNIGIQGTTSYWR